MDESKKTTENKVTNISPEAWNLCKFLAAHENKTLIRALDDLIEQVYGKAWKYNIDEIKTNIIKEGIKEKKEELDEPQDWETEST